MGIKMMVEIFDHWQDAGLTAGERNDLLVLAENANDGTRLTFGPVHEPYILRRAGKTAAAWKNAIGKLAAKKVLTVHTPGRIKQAAVYRLEPLCPGVRHDGHKGQCVRGERVTPEVTHSEKEGHLSGDPMGNPTGDPLGQEGHLTDAERVTSPVTPTPPDPSLKISSTTTPSSSMAEVSEDPTPVGPSGEDGGGGGGVSPSKDLAIEIAAALTNGQPVHRQLQETLTVRLAAALDAGWTVDGLAVYLHMGDGFTGSPAAVASWRLDPARLPEAAPLPVPARTAGGIRGVLPSAEDYAAMSVDSVFGAGRDTADGGMWERAMARANARMASTPRPGTDTAVAGWGDVARQLREHKPYSNDGWHRAADPAAAAKIPWCGHEDCDPVTRLHPAPNPLDKPFPCDDCHPGMQLQQF